MELETLEVKIQAQARQANGQIDALITRLGKLSSSLQSIDSSGINRLSTGVNRLSNSMSAMRSVDSRSFSTLARNIKTLSNIDTGKINAAAGSMRQISKSVSSFSDMSKSVQGLSELAGGIKQLGYTSSTKAIENIPKLAVAMRQLMAELSKAPMVSQNLINMTNALAKLARTGGAAGTAARSITSSFSGFTSGASSATKKSFSLASAIGKVYASYFLLFRGFGKIRDAIDISSSLTEVENVVRTTFGKYESLVNEFAADSIQKFGMSELSVKQFASRFQAMGVAMGFPQGKMADMSVQLTKLTADMASFYDVAQSDVAEDLESIFTGQTRPLTLAA
uniref:Minor tail protein n=1 Tax=virus sp. ctQ5V6 TaxID=2825815 RepID=A0A8S5RPZ6_9VIRU|nr:MAG TPA: minor tail protein [virus sp. ctQ5V6]